MVTPVSEGEEDDDLPRDPDDRSTSVLVREAAASTGITRRRSRGDEEVNPAEKRQKGGDNSL